MLVLGAFLPRLAWIRLDFCNFTGVLRVDSRSPGRARRSARAACRPDASSFRTYQLSTTDYQLPKCQRTILPRHPIIPRQKRTLAANAIFEPRRKTFPCKEK